MAKEDIASRVEAILQDYLKDKGLEIYRVQFKKEGPDWKLKVFLDKTMDAESEYVSIDECTDVSRYLNEKLDELDFIDRAYMLEVSSPGLDRELFKETDFIRYKDRLVEAKLYQAIDGRKNIEGTLISKEGGILKLLVDGVEVSIPEDKISKLNLAIVF